MNLTIGNAKANTWKSIKAQFVAAACGLALAGAALLSIDFGTQTVAGPVGLASAATASRAVVNPAGPGAVTFYLVADQAGAANAQALEEGAQWVRHDNRVPEPNRTVITLVAGSDAQYARAQSLIDDATAAANFSDGNPAPQFTVVDLR